MKKDIHPTYYADAKISCSCGAVHQYGSTVKEMHVELCSACHPFYTGKAKIVDTAGKVERFIVRAEKTKALKQAKRKQKSAKISQSNRTKASKKTQTSKKK